MESLILTGAAARRALAAGVDLVAGCVRPTLGPLGRNVALAPLRGRPKITNDGVSIAAIIETADNFQNLGCRLAQAVSARTGDQAGDGTTTALILAQAMLSEAMAHLAAGLNPVPLAEGLEQGAETAVRFLTRRAEPVRDTGDIRKIAAVASGDEELAGLVAVAVEKVGFSGIINVEEGRGVRSELEIVEGLRFDKGCFTPKIVKSWERLDETLEDAYVLVVDGKVSGAGEIFPVLEILLRRQKPLLLIAEDIAVDLLALLLANKKKGTMNAVAVMSPGSGERRGEYLADIACITGAGVIKTRDGMSLEAISEADLGRAAHVRATHESTTIIGGRGDKEIIARRADEVRRLWESRPAGWTKDKLARRLSWLQGGVAVIRVGAPTRLELLEKKDRADDAVHAVRAAITGGFIPGGGAELLRAGRELLSVQAADDEIGLGLRIAARALEEPLRQIAVNAGRSPDIIADKVAALPSGYGYDAVGDTFRDLTQAGVIDPALVTCAALRSAASIAALVVRAEGIVLNKAPGFLRAMGIA
ncbi:MAG: molecular chaperone GroEL [Gracilibacteraceae bacterium]|jgi:chaperonin GroEL|nr:molecular chaperone GroEL [Gracilibacteraceae bacterium]